MFLTTHNVYYCQHRRGLGLSRRLLENVSKCEGTAGRKEQGKAWKEWIVTWKSFLSFKGPSSGKGWWQVFTEERSQSPTRHILSLPSTGFCWAPVPPDGHILRPACRLCSLLSEMPHSLFSTDITLRQNCSPLLWFSYWIRLVFTFYMISPRS